MTIQQYQLKAGNIKNMKLVETDLPAPGPNEVSIELKAIGLNFADITVIWGLYSATPKGVFTPGLEYAGVITHCGNKVNDFKVGDKVYGITRFGAYTSHLNSDERYLRHLPEGWTFEEGAAYPVQVLTAYYALKPLGNMQPGYTVLIHSAAGGVGTLANRLAKKMGGVTIGTVGNPSKLDLLRKEGVDYPLVRDGNFFRNLDDILKERELNLILECIGGRVLMEGFKRLAPEGRSIVYSAADFVHPGDRPNYLRILWKFLRRPLIDPLKLTDGNRGILGFNLIYLYQKVERMHQYMEEISTWDIGKPIVGHSFDFQALPEAVRALQSGQTMGKVVVQVNQ